MNDADTPIATEVLKEQKPELFIRLSVAEQKAQFQRGYSAGLQSAKWLFSTTNDLIRFRVWTLSQSKVEHDTGDLNELLAMSMELITMAEHSGDYEWLSMAYTTRARLVRAIKESDYACSGFFDALDYSIYDQWKIYDSKYGSTTSQSAIMSMSAQQWAATRDLTISPSLYLAAKSLNSGLFDHSRYAESERCDDYNDDGDCWFCSE
jgi:hypothetical protein